MENSSFYKIHLQNLEQQQQKIHIFAYYVFLGDWYLQHIIYR